MPHASLDRFGGMNIHPMGAVNITPWTMECVRQDARREEGPIHGQSFRGNRFGLVFIETYHLLTNSYENVYEAFSTKYKRAFFPPVRPCRLITRGISWNTRAFSRLKYATRPGPDRPPHPNFVGRKWYKKRLFLFLPHVSFLIPSCRFTET